MSLKRDLVNGVTRSGMEFSMSIVGFFRVISSDAMQVKDGSGGYEDFQVSDGKGGYEDFETAD